MHPFSFYFPSPLTDEEAFITVAKRIDSWKLRGPCTDDNRQTICIADNSDSKLRGVLLPGRTPGKAAGCTCNQHMCTARTRKKVAKSLDSWLWEYICIQQIRRGTFPYLHLKEEKPRLQAQYSTLSWQIKTNELVCSFWDVRDAC